MDPKEEKIPCELCLAYGISEEAAGEATHKVWMEKALGCTEDRYVDICDECYENSDAE